MVKVGSGNINCDPVLTRRTYFKFSFTALHYDFDAENALFHNNFPA